MMTLEEKSLLLKDLSQRLPYGVKVTTTNPAVKIGVISGISIKNKISVETKDADIVFDCTEVKPYLRPMSSMTEEEIEEFENFVFPSEEDENGNYQTGVLEKNIPNYIDWLNSHHFDFRGLIEKGLALEATKDMYK